MTGGSTNLAAKPVTGRPSTRPMRKVFALAAVLLGVAAALILAELGLRVHVARRGWTPNCYATELAMFVPHPASGRTLRPDMRLKSTTYDVRINRMGFRGPEIETTADQSSDRIAVLGGSSVFGYLVSENLDSCRVLENLLRRSGHEVDVINAGVPGFTIRQCEARYRAMVAPMRPKVVILYLGWNDLPSLLGSTPRRAEDTAAPSLWQRTLVHSVLYGFLRYRLFPPAAPQFAPPADDSLTIKDAGAERFNRDLDNLIAAVTNSGAKVWVSTQLMAANDQCKSMERFLGQSPAQIETNRRLGRRVSESVRQAAARNGVELIEIADCVACSDATLGDAIHPTATGHRLIAECWADALLPGFQRPAVGEMSH